ncbi:MAG: metallophosphoesterase family protein [Bryobacteraceae bacterium]
MTSPICKLIHISDPHFGSQFVIDGESYWRKVVAHTPGIRHATGLFPHSYQWAGALAVAVRTILKECRDHDLPAVVVHTGDLTASGKQAEFSVGRTFLKHGHYLQSGVIAGLGLDTDFKHFVFDIPGNHDHWQRASPKARSAFDDHYGGDYPREMEIETRHGLAVLYGLDSSRSSTLNHRLANGEVSTESLARTCEKLRSRKKSGAIQVVCLHHPLFLRTRTAPQMLGREVLKLKNRVAIAKALAESGAHLALAGHVHQQQHPYRGQLRPLHFIAGSACQIRSRPSFWTLDLYPEHVEYGYFQVPRSGIHFERVVSRSGSSVY